MSLTPTHPGRQAVLAVGIVAVTLLSYLPVLKCGYIWDDEDYVINNSTLRSGDGLRRIWFEPGATRQYYPLVHTTYWVEYQLWGLRPAGYHLTNVVLHALSAVMIWILLRRLDVPGALFASLLFALHPVHVESVAWITERKNTLSGLLYLSSAWCYLRFFFDATSRWRWFWYVLSIVTFAAAMTSKTVTVTLPAALLVVIIWRQGGFRWRQVWPLLPMFAVGIPLALTTVWMERNVVGTKYVLWELSWIDRCLIAGRAICFYFAKLVWPARLAFIYPRWEIDATQAWQFVYPLVVFVAIAVAWFGRRRMGGGLLVAILLFAGTLTPALGFVDVYPMRFSFVADHFQYLASIAPLVFLAAAATRLLSRCKMPDPVERNVGIAAAAVVLACLLVVSGRTCAKYQNLETLWTDTIEKNPNSQLALAGLGQIRADRGNLLDAVELYQRAIEADPNFSQIHSNLSAIYGRQQKFDKAREHAQRAVELQPDHLGARVNLGRACLRLNELEIARTHLNEAVRLSPDFVPARLVLAETLRALGDATAARNHLQHALELGARSPQLYRVLVAVERDLGNEDKAREYERQLQSFLRRPPVFGPGFR